MTLLTPPPSMIHGDPTHSLNNMVVGLVVHGDPKEKGEAIQLCPRHSLGWWIQKEKLPLLCLVPPLSMGNRRTRQHLKERRRRLVIRLMWFWGKDEKVATTSVAIDVTGGFVRVMDCVLGYHCSKNKWKYIFQFYPKHIECVNSMPRSWYHWREDSSSWQTPKIQRCL